MGRAHACRPCAPSCASPQPDPDPTGPPRPRAAAAARARSLRHEVRRQDRYLVLGSDGLYDVLKPKMVAQICASGKHNAQRAAHDLMKAVARKGCTDDTTIVVATLELEV